MKHPKKTALALLLTLCLTLGLLPALSGTAYADGEDITSNITIKVSSACSSDDMTVSSMVKNEYTVKEGVTITFECSKYWTEAVTIYLNGTAVATWAGSADYSSTYVWTAKKDAKINWAGYDQPNANIYLTETDAPSYTITLEPKNASIETITEVTQGDTFNLGVKVGGGAFAGATVTIGYDATAFTAGDVTWATGTSGTVNKDTTGKIGLVQLTTSEQADGTTIATIPFTAGTSATAQDYNFTVDSNQISLDVNDNTQTATATGATVTVKVAEAPKYDVTLSGATGNAQATRGVDYVATISEYDAVNYNYTVTATVGGSSVTPTISGATITIPGASVTGAVSITVTPSLSFTVNVYADYVSGWTLVTVKAPSGSTAVYTYDGGNLYNLARESAYGILVEGTVSKTTAEGKIALGTETLGEIPASGYDVNGTDKTDYSDVLMTYRVSQKAYSTPSAAMESYLRADVDGSHKVDMTDVNTVISNLSAS